MIITDIIKSEKRSLSFEVFPPKTRDKYESVSSAVAEIAKLKPSYMSVTYGAGGGTSTYTAKIAQEVASHNVTSLAHLSCISSTKTDIYNQLNQLKTLNIKNILALRGDIPEGLDKSELEFHYAFELIDEIKKYGDFCIGGACYPECHPESLNQEKDLEFLKIKVDHGCEFLTTQMFFDNDIFYSFLDKATKKGINVPIIAGIMPITSISQLDKMVSISGNAIPQKFMSIIQKYEKDPFSLKDACIHYASEQARDIYLNGFNSVHIYSMNKPQTAIEISNNLKDLIK